MKDITRGNDFMQKVGVCYAAYVFDAAVMEGIDFDDALHQYKVGNLPPEALITDAQVFTQDASDATTVVVGTTVGGTEILSAGDTATPGKTGTFTGETDTGTGVPVYLDFGAEPTTGKFVVLIEYVEYRKHTGEYTKITN